MQIPVFGSVTTIMYKLVVSGQLIVFGSEKLTTILFVGKMLHLNFPVKLVMITGRVVD